MKNTHHNIFILGRHKLACSCYEKLMKGKAAGALSFESLTLVADPYHQFIRDYVNDTKNHHPDDVLVPDHTAKHVMLEVFIGIVEKKFPHLKTRLTPFEAEFETPFLKKGDDNAVWAMSYATWTCPPDCDEPTICPHTEATRTWDFNHSLEALFKKIAPSDRHTVASSQSRPLARSCYRFPCTPLYAEISCIPFTHITSSVTDFMKRIEQNSLPLSVIVATHSHCHAILGKFEVDK